MTERTHLPFWQSPPAPHRAIEAADPGVKLAHREPGAAHTSPYGGWGMGSGGWGPIHRTPIPHRPSPGTMRDTQRLGIVLLGFLIEGSLAGLAAGLGWLFGRSPFED